MTLTFRTTRRVYQSHNRGAPDGVISSPLARFASTNGEFQITDENARKRLFDNTNPFTPAANWINRLVTVRNTPPAASSAGTRRAENWTFRIKDVDVSGGWIELEGFRTDVAGTAISYAVHACATFASASANFPTDEAPALERTNTGPVIHQAIYLPQPANQTLRLVPWEVTGRNSATSLRISDPFDLVGNIPTESTLQWQLRDPPAYTPEEVTRKIHRFMLQCGWECFQFRGRNNGNAAGKRLHVDIIYKSLGESGVNPQYLRMVTLQQNALGNWQSSNFQGWDFAMFSAWDRDFANGAADLNPGNGVNAVHNGDSAINTSTWAAQADGTNAGNQGPIWHVLSTGGTVVHNGSTFYSGTPNVLNTPDGGDVHEIGYTLFGNKDAVELYFECFGVGHMHVSLGTLAPRPDGNSNNFIANSRIPSGANPTIRIGGPQKGAAGYPSNGVNPQSPGSGLAYQVGDAFQVVGQKVNAGISPTVSHNGEFIESSTIIAFPGILAARGTITTIAATLIADGSTFTLDDGTNAGGPNGNGIYVFEFDKNASVSGTNIAVTIVDGQTADQVRDAIVSAVNGTVIGITASSGGSASVALVNDVVGGAGNATITETVADTGFVVDGMDGGGYSVQLAALTYSYVYGALVGEDPQPMYVAKPYHMTVTAGTNPFTVSGSIRLSNRARFNDATYKDHNGPSMVNGNGFSATMVFGGAADLIEQNPSDRTGRFGIVPVFARDSTGGQLRGSLRHFRAVPMRTGAFKFIRDRQGKYHFLLPFRNVISLNGTEASQFNVALGPMPQGMVVVS